MTGSPSKAFGAGEFPRYVHPDGPELVLGLVAAVGTNLDAALHCLTVALQEMDYQPHDVRLSRLLVPLGPDLVNSQLEPRVEPKRTWDRQDAGNALRERTGRADALAVLAISEVRRIRQEIAGDPDKPIGRHAFLFRSLKNPEEVVALRRIYGDGFLLLGVYTPKKQRLKNLAKKIALSKGQIDPAPFSDDAERVDLRDQAEDHTLFGQNVRETYKEADVFLNATDDNSLRLSSVRFVELLFKQPFNTPTRAEHCMFQAYASKLRSSALGRQVGAALANQFEEVFALGTNEVPKPGGGEYSADDADEERDFRKGEDISDKKKRQTLQEILAVLDAKSLLKKPVNEALIEDVASGLKGTLFDGLIEFMRTEHAECSAILSAARMGVPVRDATLYCTTFPCHDCTRHIVTAGIKRVVYIEPYPKSLGPELHKDAVRVDEADSHDGKVSFEPFVGIGPRIFPEVFLMDKRKEKGRVVNWPAERQAPRFGVADPLFFIRESEELTDLAKRMLDGKVGGLKV